MYFPRSFYFCPTFKHHINSNDKYGEYFQFARQGLLHPVYSDVSVPDYGIGPDALQPELYPGFCEINPSFRIIYSAPSPASD